MTCRTPGLILFLLVLAVAGALAGLRPAETKAQSAGSPELDGWINDPLAVRDLVRAYRFQLDPATLEESWERAIVFVPGEEFGHFTYGFMGMTAVRDRLVAVPAGRRYPLVIYLHDADGLTAVENSLMEEFEIENMAALFPDSMAKQFETAYDGYARAIVNADHAE